MNDLYTVIDDDPTRVLKVLEHWSFDLRKALLGQRNLAEIAEIPLWRIGRAVDDALPLIAQKHPGYALLIDGRDQGYSIENRHSRGHVAAILQRARKATTATARVAQEINVEHVDPGLEKIGEVFRDSAISNDAILDAYAEVAQLKARVAELEAELLGSDVHKLPEALAGV